MLHLYKLFMTCTHKNVKHFVKNTLKSHTRSIHSNYILYSKSVLLDAKFPCRKLVRRYTSIRNWLQINTWKLNVVKYSISKYFAREKNLKKIKRGNRCLYLRITFCFDVLYNSNYCCLVVVLKICEHFNSNPS